MKPGVHTVAFLALTILLVNDVRSVSYYYDDAGRLIQIAYEEGNGVVYRYDDNDNLLSQTSVAVPAAPQNLIVSESPEVGITVQWESSTGTEEYFIYRRLESRSAWINIATVPQGTLAFLDVSAVAGSKYMYRVVGSGTEGLSAYSASTVMVGLFEERVSIQIVSQTAMSRIFKITFSSMESESYSLERSTTLEAGDWSAASYSTIEAGVASQEPIVGDGEETVLFIEIEDGASPLFYRIVQRP